MGYIPIRYLIVAALFLATIATCVNKDNLYTTIIAMVTQHEQKHDNSSLCPDLLPNNNTFHYPALSSNPFGRPLSVVVWPASMSTEERNKTSDKFDWSPELQGTILGSFFWLCFIFQTPAGYIADRWGGRVPVAVSLLLTGTISLAAPIATETSAWLLISLRVAMGFVQAGIYSGIFVIFCNWIPECERSLALALLGSGGVFSGIMLQFFTGYLITQYTWRSMFYVPGAISLITFLLVIPFIRNKPETHPLITRAELTYIQRKGTDEEPLENDDGRADDVQVIAGTSERDPVPWVEILTNGPVLVAFVLKFAVSLCGSLIASEIPTYFASVFHMQVGEISVVNATSNVIFLVGMIGSAKVSEEFIVRGWMSRTTTRKLFSLFSGTLAAVTVVLIPLSRCNKTLVISMFYVYSILSSFCAATDIPLAAEMTNKFPGVLFSVFNVASSSPGFIAPMFAGSILGRVADQWMAWDIIFYATSGVVVAANIIFLMCGSACTQPFDNRKEVRRETQPVA